MSAHNSAHPTLALAVTLAISAAFIVTTVARQQPPRDSSASASADAVHETDHLTIRTSVGAAATPGARVALIVEVTPKPRMHVYAPAQQEYIPVSLTLEKSEAFTAHAPVFPPAEQYFFKPLEETQLVYSKPFKIRQEITVAQTSALRERARAASVALSISGTLRYQACDDSICYMPKTVPVRWTVGLKPQR